MKEYPDWALHIAIFLFMASYVAIGLYVFYLTGL